MASRRSYSLREAIELVLEPGSDVEDEVLDNGEDGEDDFDDVGDLTLVRDDDLDPQRDEEESDSAPGPHGQNNAEEADVDMCDERAVHAAANDDLPMYIDEEAEESWMYDWVRDVSNFPLTAPFTGEPGLCLPEDFPRSPTPVDFYELFIDQELVRHFKVETNRYASAVCRQKKALGGLSPRSIYNIWKPVTLEEMNRFIAILIHMGLVKKPKISDYWSTDPSLQTTFASRLMKRERFRGILAFFHLNDNSNFIPRGQEGHDPLFKLRPLFDHLNERFKILYKPEENICIDEAMCPWRGRSVMRVYMRDKPTKWGIKLYELCESSSGYVFNMEVMCRSPGVSNAPFDVCLRLLEPLENKGHTLYVDNYYCNPALAETLAAENTQVVGTVRANRVGMPKDLVNAPLQRGEMDFRRKNQVLCVRWKDKRDVYMLSTRHLPAMREVRSRAETKMKPVCVVDYIGNMAGVDKSDQMISYLPLHRKTIKWWKKLGLHLLTLTMIQSHILYNKYRRQRGLKSLQLDAYVKSVCNNFAAVPAEKENARPLGAADETASAEVMRLQPGNHWPMVIPPVREDQARRTSRGCKVCYAKMKYKGATRDELKKKKHTSFQCEQCKVPLCVEPCFKVFHTVKDYGR